MKRFLMLGLLLLASAASVPLQAQDSAGAPVDLRGGSIGAGSRVRLSVPSVSPDPLVGRVAALTADSLLLSRGSGVHLQLDSRAIQRVEVSAGRHRVRWALAGAVVGMLVGGVAGGSAGGKGDDSGLGALAGFVAGVIVGTPLGAGVGALAAPERWRPVALPRPAS
jgi:hypothetical protein